MMLDEKVKTLYELIKNAKHIVFFGGAGVSTASGIKDFRSKDGLYNLHSKYGVPYEIILSHSYYENNPETFFQFYKEFMINKDAKPNIVHKFVAKLEKTKDLTIITQNIDNLHQLAGSKNVIELHGSINRNYCERCATFYNLDELLSIKSTIPICPKCGGIIKPDVVLYEEPLNQNIIAKAIISIEKADLLIVAGTSLQVYPAAGLINYFYGDKIVLINREHLNVNKKTILTIEDDMKIVFEKLNYLFG